MGLLIFTLFLSNSAAVVATTDTTSNTTAVESATPVKHLVVIFQENVSFDHYFATYPFALNPLGEPHFVPSPKTPSVVNNLRTVGLLNHNPNSALPFITFLLDVNPPLPICPIPLHNPSIKFSNIQDGFSAFASKADPLLVGRAAEMAGFRP